MKDLYKDLIKPMVSYQENNHNDQNRDYMSSLMESSKELKLSESKQQLVSSLAHKLDIKRKQLNQEKASTNFMLKKVLPNLNNSSKVAN